MPQRAVHACALTLAACAPQERVVPRYEPVEVYVEVPVHCPYPAIPEVAGDDRAPTGSDIEAAAIHVLNRLDMHRTEKAALRRALRVCAGKEAPPL